MKEFANNKKKMISLLVFGIIMVLMGVSYAWFNYTKTGANNRLIMGNIYLTLNEGTDQINLENVFPMTKEEARAKTNNFITFTLSGLNTSNKDVYYEIKLKYGDDKNGYTRFNDKDLVFDLVEIGDNNEETYIVDAKSFDSINDKRIWVDTVNHNTTTEITKTYKLRVWLNEDVIISDTDPNATYPATGSNAFKNHYASTKIEVFGDFQEKEMPVYAYELLKKNSDKTTQIDFGINSSNTNGKGLYLLKGTESDANPIYYYRGEIDNNNVVFGGFCWKIVRTTDTGGIKMIYSGVATESNGEYQCNNSAVSKGFINNGGDDVNISSSASFGRTISYNFDAGTFTIEDIVKENNSPIRWNTANADKLVGTYTCNSSATTCSTIYYVGYYISNRQASLGSITIGDMENYSYIGQTSWNAGGFYAPLALSGYMYNDTYRSVQTSTTSGIYYGSGVSYNESTGKYTLTNANVTALDNSHHYSCNLSSSTGTCAKVRYYYHTSNYIELEGGATIEDAIYKMTGNGDTIIKNKAINQDYDLNKIDSLVKSIIELWFKNNLTNEIEVSRINYQNYLEDTVICNDRSFSETGNNTLLKSGWNPNPDGISGNGDPATYPYYNISTRLRNNWYSTTNVPIFTCPNEVDRFTVSNENGNGKLKYPVGLLTADELILAGLAGNSSTKNNTYYLYTNARQMTITPNYHSDNSPYFVDVNSISWLTASSIYVSEGVRPVISLKPGIEFEKNGDGTPTNPYVVKYD